MGKQPGLGAANFGRRTPRDGCQLPACAQGTLCITGTVGTLWALGESATEGALCPLPGQGLLSASCAWEPLELVFFFLYLVVNQVCSPAKSREKCSPWK